MSLPTEIVVVHNEKPLKNYKAKYAIEFFARKKIGSYALWAIYIKADGRYPKIPNAYGKTQTLEHAHIELTEWCTNNNISFPDMRSDMAPWRLVKDLLEGKSGAEYFARAIKKQDVVLTLNTNVENLVAMKNNHAFTTSLKVAEKFKKRHDNVIQAIKNLPDDEFRLLNFKESFYINEQNKSQPMYEITWKGFSILAMGFNGKEAYEWKRKFLDAFESMGDMIYRHKEMHNDHAWQQTRLEALAGRRQETDAIKEFIDYAKARGSTHADSYYTSITKGTYKALFLLEADANWKGLRERLSTMQLTTLTIAEQIAQKYMREGMAMDMPYKDIYKYCIAKVEAFADIFGKNKISATHVKSI